VDDAGHQPQHAARSLELVQRRPLVVEPVEELGMDGIRGGDPPLVVRLATRGWDLRSLRSVEIGEVTNDRVALRGLVRRYVFEKSTANDLKALIGTRGAPRGLHSSHDVLKTLKRRLTALTANLDVRGRDGHDQKHPRHCASGLGERLSEGELSIERPGGESIYAVELPRVGDPFVDEDQARRLRLKQLDQPGPRARARSRFSGAVFPPRFSVQRRRPRSHSISACRAEVLPASLGPTNRTGFPSSTSTSSKRLKFRMATFVSIALAYGAGLDRGGRGAAACENT